MAKTAILAVKIVGDAKNGAKALGDTTTKADNLFGKIKTGAAIAGAALAAATGAAIAFGTDAVKKAGDLEQSMGAIDTVFKGSAGQMHTWAKGAATSVGLTRNEFNELGTLIGTQLKNGGTAMDELAPKTNELITLGADLSSMFGGTTADAVGALSSALKGERDPIERYGVSLKQATIDAKAAEMGFQKVGGSLSNEAQQAATLALIMEQTADAHGNFAKEADTLQGKQQRLAAQIENVKTGIGSALLPIVVKIADAFATKLMPVIENAGKTISAFITSLNFQAVGQQLKALDFSAITSRIMPIVNTLRTAFTNAATVISDWATGMYARLQPIIPTVQSIFGSAAEIIADIIGIISENVKKVTQGIKIAWEIIGEPIMNVVSTVWSAIVGIIDPALKTIKGVIKTVLSVIRGDWSGAWQGIKTATSGVVGLIKGIISGGLRVISSIVANIGRAIQNAWRTAWNGVKSATAGALSGVKNGVQSGLSAVVGFFRSLPGKISGALSGIGSRMASIGRNMMQSLARALSPSAIISKMRSVIGDAISFAKRILGIASPSKVFTKIGQQTGDGLVKGLGLSERAVTRASGDLVGAAIPSRLPSLSPSRRGSSAGAPGGITINVTGALDPSAVAKQIRDLLNRDARLRGAVDLGGAVVA